MSNSHQRLCATVMTLAISHSLFQSTSAGLIEEFIATEDLGQKVLDVLEERRISAVRLNEIRYVGPSVSTAGPGFQAALKEFLEAKQIEVADGKKKLESDSLGFIAGEYSFAIEPPSVRLELKIGDSNGATSGVIPGTSQNQELVAAIAGIQVSLPRDDRDPKKSEDAAQAAISAALKEQSDPTQSPPIVIEPDKSISSTGGSAPLTRLALEEQLSAGNVRTSVYSIEVLVKKKGESPDAYRPREITKNADGEPFVDIQPGEVYAIRLNNDAAHYDAGVSIYIDGLSTFHFSDNEAFRKTDKWLIPKNGSGLIQGWHRAGQGNDTVLNEFEVARYGDLNAADQGADREFGTITVTFCAAWRSGEPEPGPHLDGRLLSQGLNSSVTVPGQEIAVKMNTETRIFGGPRAVITLRYDKNR